MSLTDKQKRVAQEAYVFAIKGPDAWDDIYAAVEAVLEPYKQALRDANWSLTEEDQKAWRLKHHHILEGL